MARSVWTGCGRPKPSAAVTSSATSRSTTEAVAISPFSVRQVVRLGLAGKTGMLRAFSREDLAFVDSLLERVGVADVADRPIGELSGGQLQRAYIARSLAPRPRLLLLDEPTTGIDRGGQQRFIEFLAGLKNDLQLTVVFVSHDLRGVGDQRSDRLPGQRSPLSRRPGSPSGRPGLPPLRL